MSSCVCLAAIVVLKYICPDSIAMAGMSNGGLATLSISSKYLPRSSFAAFSGEDIVAGWKRREVLC